MPSPAEARNSAPDLISTTHAVLTSPIVGSPSPTGARATATHADSSPASAGRVPSIGSTTSTSVASAVRHQTAVLGVKGDSRSPLGQELHQRLLGELIDREGDVAAGAIAKVGPTGVGAELGNHDLTQPDGEVADQLLPVALRGQGVGHRSRGRYSTVT